MDNLIGKKFNKLIILSFSYKDKRYDKYYLCKCDCGKEKIIRGSNIKSGITRSCGCLKGQAKNQLTHGLSKSKFYYTHNGIKQRCLNKNDIAYKYYGNRGIKICDKWLKFENFKNDMYESYQEHCEKFGTKNTSIDRINNNKGYYKENCHWATQKEQMNNTRANIKLKDLDGKILSIKEFAKKYNLTITQTKARLKCRNNINDIINFKNKTKEKSRPYQELYNEYKKNLHLLPTKTIAILKYRFENNLTTLEKTGKEFSVSRQRIEQIQKQAFNILVYA